MFLRHPRFFLRHLLSGPKRYRGTKEEIVANAERLGLGEYYGLHPWGVEIKKPEIYKKGLALQDIYRVNLIGDAPVLQDIDRFQALAAAGEYARQIHDKYGAIGELLSNDIIFQGKEDGKVVNPVLNMPDIVFNQIKKMSLPEQKAMDILDFLNHIGYEELRRSGDWSTLGKALQTILDHYGDNMVIKAVESLAKRGRLTLRGDEDVLHLKESVTTKLRPIFSQHNQARLSSSPAFAGKLRKKIIQSCDQYLEAHPKA